MPHNILSVAWGKESQNITCNNGQSVTMCICTLGLAEISEDGMDITSQENVLSGF